MKNEITNFRNFQSPFFFKFALKFFTIVSYNKKHLKNAGPIRHCEPFYMAIHQVSLLSHVATVARRLRIDVHDDDDDNNDNA